MCELLVGLPEVTVLGFEDEVGAPLSIHVETRARRPGCSECGVLARVNGRHARTVNEIAIELGCDWHTINDTVVAYGTALVEHKDRFGTVEALGLDEVLFARIGAWHRQEFSTQIIDVNAGQLLDVVPGRSGDKPKEWLEAKGKDWRDDVRWATLDLSGPYRAVFDEKLPGATQVADPFHVVKLGNTKLDECRRRVQNETMGHRGHKSDPLYRCRRLLTKADERIDEKGKEKLLGLLRAGDPRGEVDHHLACQ